MTIIVQEPPAIVVPECQECFDTWMWLAVYHDGTPMQECYGTGAEHHTFADIDLDQLDCLSWIPRYDGLPQIVLPITEPTMRPILFRRRLLELNVSAETTSGRQTIHCLGWQKNLGDGCNVESFTFVFEDGSVLVSSDRNAV